jgi:hypothetical protein
MLVGMADFCCTNGKIGLPMYFTNSVFLCRGRNDGRQIGHLVLRNLDLTRKEGRYEKADSF